MRYAPTPCIAIAIAACFFPPNRCTAADDSDGVLPSGVRAVWDSKRAFRETTASRERICINGLWRWQPGQESPGDVPQRRWGYFKVPGCWPGITDYMQKDCQTVFVHPEWKAERLNSVNAAWYQREITIPREWSGRRIALSVEYLNSLATVFIDGKRVEDISFPGGELELTPFCRPGDTQVLSLHVASLPLKGVLLAFNDTNTARSVRGSVARRGLCGDVFLVSHPSKERIADVRISTSVRRGELTIDAGFAGLAPDSDYSLAVTAKAAGGVVQAFTTRKFRSNELTNGRLTFVQQWLPEKLWDTHTPENQFELTVALRDQRDAVLDTSFSQRFGFREFWIDGRDFVLNGSRIFLCAVPLDNAQVSAELASYAGARESLRRLKDIGVNFVYTHNYGCEPGTHLGFEEILTAADDAGMLVAFSQPHFGQYDWQSPDADERNGYGRHAEYYVRRAQNHPSVVAYAMSHNATGYGEDMNPDLMDGIQDPRSQGERNYAQRALRAEAVVRAFDPGRIVYHHSSGNLGSMHTVNFYPNFCPIQELSDWFQHWSTAGVKPMFTCEYGAPFSWDWAMYRGWFAGERSFGSARVPWDLCIAEWNAQFMGDAAFQVSDAEKTNLRWEAKQFRAGNLWHRWDYPFDLNSKRFDERYPIMARYLSDNWRAFRVWNVSAISPWEHAQYWKLLDGVNRKRQELAVDWENLQRPGFSADYIDQRYERLDLAYGRDDWEATPAADALLRNNRPLLATIAGKPDAVTSKDHNFFAGEPIEKQLVVINNSRTHATCECRWSCDIPGTSAGSMEVALATGQQARVPITIPIPVNTPPGRYELKAQFKFGSGERQQDSIVIHVLPRPPGQPPRPRVALFDPKGETRALLSRIGLACEAIGARDDLARFDTLIIGKQAITPDGDVPNIGRVNDGLRVVVFEQTAEALEKRLGFRVTEYGLRQVFRRIPSHPLLEGLSDEHLQDWRGSATLLPPQLSYEMRPRHGPTVSWCGIPVSRLWRSGNRGNVASVLIEKPARGDFLPILDGGYSLQYAALLEYRQGKGLILFSQLDLTARTEAEPAAETLMRNIVSYVASWRPTPRRTVLYAGDQAGAAHLESCGVPFEPYHRSRLTADKVLVLGPGAGATLRGDAPAIDAWLRSGGSMLAVGLDASDVQALGLQLTFEKGEHISAYFDCAKAPSLLTGVGPADLHNRDPREIPLVRSGATIVGDGVVAQVPDRKFVVCQAVPWQFSRDKLNQKKTFRRSAFLVTRLLANMGAAASTPLPDRISTPLANATDRRWLVGLYLDEPEEWDDPYRFFRW